MNTPTSQVWQEAVQRDQGAVLLGRVMGRDELHTEHSGTQDQNFGEMDIVNMTYLLSVHICLII